jgi:hypothetical protein
MAITIQKQPAGPQPVYNPSYYQVLSNQIAQPQFRYVFDVYKDGAFVQRLKHLARPVTSAAIFSPNRVIESYLSYDIAFNYNIATVQTNSVAQYTVQFGEEYGPTTAAPVVYSGLTSASGMTFNGVAQYADYYNAYTGTAFTKYYLKDNTLYPESGKFLTNAPSAQTVTITDRATLSAFNFTTGDTATSTMKRARILQVVTYQNSGGTKARLIDYSYISASTIGYKIIHFPVGPYNLNNVPTAYIKSGGTTQPIINFDTDYQYEVRLFEYSASTFTGSPVSETRVFTEQDCSKYENVRVAFLNRLGAFDFFNFNKVKQTTITSTPTTFKKNIPMTYYLGSTIGNRETTVFNTQNEKTVKLNSNWVTDEEATWMEELWTSPEVYECAFDSSGNLSLLPIVMRSSSQEIKNRVNNQIFNYTIEYAYASEVNSQRS